MRRPGCASTLRGTGGQQRGAGRKRALSCAEEYVHHARGVGIFGIHSEVSRLLVDDPRAVRQAHAEGCRMRSENGVGRHCGGGKQQGSVPRSARTGQQREGRRGRGLLQKKRENTSFRPSYVESFCATNVQILTFRIIFTSSPISRTTRLWLMYTGLKSSTLWSGLPPFPHTSAMENLCPHL